MEQSGFVIYKTWKSEYRLFCALVASMFLCVFLSREFPKSVVSGELFTVGTETVYLSLPVFWIFPFIFYSLALIHIYNVKYRLTEKGLEMTTGIISTKKRSVKIRYEDIRSVETAQTILERILNIGTVEIGTSATGAIEVVYEGVDSPQEIQALIQKEKGRRLSLMKDAKIINPSID